jgi:Cft2 family RNA processing exonuclease
VARRGPSAPARAELEFVGEGTSGQALRVLASGDIGPDAKLIQPDPEDPSGFDYLITESTYGDRIRAVVTPQQRRERLATEVREAAAANGALLIPAFAVERTQELIVDLVGLMERKEIPIAPIFLDRRWRSRHRGISPSSDKLDRQRADQCDHPRQDQDLDGIKAHGR